MKKRLYILFFLIISIFLYSNSSRKEIVSSLFRSVEEWMGTEYKYGGLSETGIDCSAFVIKVYKEVFNKSLPRTVKDQKNLGIAVTNQMQPGDLLFFNINGTISHVGIYVFDNKFIHAASSGPETGVIKSSLDEKYYKDRFAFAKRIITLPSFAEEEKKSKSENLEAQIIFGKVLFRGKLLEKSNEFKEGMPIFLEIENDDKKDVNLIVKQVIDGEIKNVDSCTKENILISTKDSQKEFVKLYLPKGSYQFELISNVNNTIFQKNILVN